MNSNPMAFETNVKGAKNRTTQTGNDYIKNINVTNSSQPENYTGAGPTLRTTYLFFLITIAVLCIVMLILTIHNIFEINQLRHEIHILRIELKIPSYE